MHTPLTHPILLLLRSYDPSKFIGANAELAQCLDQIRTGYYNPSQPDLFIDLYRTLAHHDRFMVCADYEDYLRAQAEVERAYRVSGSGGVLSVSRGGGNRRVGHLPPPPYISRKSHRLYVRVLCYRSLMWLN